MYFLAGAIAVCAWILPAVSGSYIVLVLGMYAAVIDAIRSVEVLTLLVFGAGCALGLMLFVRLLKRLLATYYAPLLSVLTGFMLGSVANLWPWQQQSEDLDARFLSPGVYADLTGEPAFVLAAVLSVLSGMGLLWWVSSRRV